MEHIPQPTLKANGMHRKDPSIAAINEAFPNKYFTFRIIGEKYIIDQIKKLNQKKATQGTDIPVKVLEENADLFPENLYVFLVRQLSITPVFKKVSKNQKWN